MAERLPSPSPMIDLPDSPEFETDIRLVLFEVFVYLVLLLGLVASANAPVAAI